MTEKIDTLRARLHQAHSLVIALQIADEHESLKPKVRDGYLSALQTLLEQAQATVEVLDDSSDQPPPPNPDQAATQAWVDDDHVTEQLTHKEANFADVLAGITKFGVGPGKFPKDPDGLAQYKQALAFSVCGDLISAKHMLLQFVPAIRHAGDFNDAQVIGHALKQAAERIIALSDIGEDVANLIEKSASSPHQTVHVTALHR